MRYRIPIGIKIRPYSTETGVTGVTVRTTVLVEFSEEEILARIPEDSGEQRIVCICLSLDANPSIYDSYLVDVADVEKLYS